MKNDLISIIVPVYNVPHKMLQKCLDSLKKQTYLNLEIIVIDDGSTDKECSKICDNYKKDKRFKIIHKENGGLCDARNYGVNNATGEWISFVDGDDYIDEDTFKEVMKNIPNNYDIICFGTIKEFKNKKFKYNYNGVFNKSNIIKTNEEMLKILLDFNSNIGDVTAKLYKKTFLLKNNLFHNSSIKQGVEAIDFNLRCFEKANGLRFIDFYGYNYAYNSESITMTMNSKSLKLLLLGIEQLYSDVYESKYCDVLLDLLDCRINYVVVTTAISGAFSNGNTYAFGKKIILEMLDNKYINKAINNSKIRIDKKRKMLLFFIKHKMFILIYIASIIRKIQKRISL